MHAVLQFTHRPIKDVNVEMEGDVPLLRVH